jgi:hypothetical protein
MRRWRLTSGAERRRLEEDSRREENWKRWGPYLSERQWGTVREDYSPDGSFWDYFPHEHARSRAYRWGEDGLLGISDREARLCFALALWNGRDAILKERLFGLTGPQGNHGEDVKEAYFYLDSTPTHSYMKALYKYPLGEYPYARLIEENRHRGFGDPEFELTETGAFDNDRYVDVLAEYSKATPDDILIRITLANRSAEDTVLHVLPTLWFRNTWSWGRTGEAYWPRPRLHQTAPARVHAEHSTLGVFVLAVAADAAGHTPDLLFTENETNMARLFGAPNPTPYVKDAFHEYVVHGRTDAVNPEKTGTKAAAHYRLAVPAHGEIALSLRLTSEAHVTDVPFGPEFETTFERRRQEADAFYDQQTPFELSGVERQVTRQSYAGLLWSKQFFHYIVKDWLDGDPSQPPPPAERRHGRNHDWKHIYNRDLISMPDKWEYPWYAAWDLAFQMIAFARVDAQFAKEQLVLLLREWYMQPNGHLPAYELALGDVNPPVHAWACWRVYKMSARRGARDRVFLARCFESC